MIRCMPLAASPPSAALVEAKQTVDLGLVEHACRLHAALPGILLAIEIGTPGGRKIPRRCHSMTSSTNSTSVTWAGAAAVSGAADQFLPQAIAALRATQFLRPHVAQVGLEHVLYARHGGCHRCLVRPAGEFQLGVHLDEAWPLPRNVQVAEDLRDIGIDRRRRGLSLHLRAGLAGSRALVAEQIWDDAAEPAARANGNEQDRHCQKQHLALLLLCLTFGGWRCVMLGHGADVTMGGLMKRCQADRPAWLAPIY